MDSLPAPLHQEDGMTKPPRALAGGASKLFSFVWEGGTDGAWGMLGADKSDVEISKGLRVRAEKLLADAAAADLPSSTLGAILVIACEGARHETTPMSDWTSLARYLFHAEMAYHFETTRLPVPASVTSHKKKKKSVQVPFFVPPSILEWEQPDRGSSSDSPRPRAYTVFPDGGGLCTYRHGEKATLHLDLTSDLKMDKLMQGFKTNFSEIMTATEVACAERSIGRLPSIIERGFDLLSGAFSQMSPLGPAVASSAPSTSTTLTLAPSARPASSASSTSKSASKPTSAKQGGSDSKRAPTAEEKRLLQEVTRLRAELEKQKPKVEGKVEGWDKQVPAKLQHVVEPSSGPAVKKEKPTSPIASTCPVSPTSRRFPPAVAQDYVIRRLSEQLQQVSSKLRVKTEENLELLLRLATKEGQIKEEAPGKLTFSG
ncbi:hypothetical protein JCM11251_007601 [Rhodosporidiobolus azoricus]